MHGMMMNRPLRIADIITLAEKFIQMKNNIKNSSGKSPYHSYAEIALRSGKCLRHLS